MSELAEDFSAQKVEGKNKRGRKILIFCTVSILNVALFVFLGIQLLTPAPRASSDPLVGHAAPNFSLLTLRPSAEQMSLSQFEGKAIVLNFWASWCGPCKEEATLLERSWKQVQAQGKDIVFLGIDYQDSTMNGRSFLLLYNITYPVMVDGDGSIAIKYSVTSLPNTLFIDRNGKVMSRVPQQLTSHLLSSNLQLIL